MSMTIYAATIETDAEGRKLVEPVIDFLCHERVILADNAEERSENGDDPFVENPDFVENAGMTLANANARHLFGALGLEADDEHMLYAIDDLLLAAMLGRNGTAAEVTREATVDAAPGRMTMIDCGVDRSRMESYLTRLHAIIVEGRKRGATHVACV